MKKAYFNWSSGKDSALALYQILQEDTLEIATLLTTVNKEFKRVSWIQCSNATKRISFLILLSYKF